LMSEQIIVIHRYDPNTFTACKTTWPETHDEEGWETMETIGFLDNDSKFRMELIDQGFLRKEFIQVPEDFQRYLTYNVLPIEWHNGMDELHTRVTIYEKE